MKRILSVLMAITITMGVPMMTACSKPSTIAEAYKDYFPVGAAVGKTSMEYGSYDDLLKDFNSITAENEMKWKALQPERNSFRFVESGADAMVQYAKDNGKKVRGHALLWHSSAPDYIFTRAGREATKAEVLEDITNHITAVLNQYDETEIYCWDVVNEVIDDGSAQYRNSKFYQITGTEYIWHAFRTARELNPKIKLYYNDYEMINPVKRAKTIQMIQAMQADGVPIDGVGMQAHYNIHNFNFEEFEKAIIEFSELGIDVQITELDFSVYQSDSSPQINVVSDQLLALQARCYQKLFEIMRKHKDKITGVTLWGVADDYTWLDNFPVSGRKNYPLLFDEMQTPKPAYYAVRDFR